MKKETFIAVFLGVTFGIVLSVIMISKTRETNLSKTKPLTSTKKETSSVVFTKENQGVSFKVNEPSDNQVFSVNSVTIKGEAESGALLIVQSPIKDYVLKVEKDRFSFNMPLALGENVIHLTVYPQSEQGRVQQKELRVFYIEE